MGANLLERLTALSDELSKSERRVAQAVLEQPQLTVTENIAQLARRAGVSEPTVFRFSKHFGVSGFPEFKLALSGALSQDTVRHPRRVAPGDSVADVIGKVTANVAAAAAAVGRNLDAVQLARAIDVLSQARRLCVCASGLSLGVAQDFYYRLLRWGLPCELCGTDQSMLMVAAVLRQGDAVLAFSASGGARPVVLAAREAATHGAQIIGVCPSGSELAQVSVIGLYCGEKIAGADVNPGVRMMQWCTGQILQAGIMLRRADAVKELAATVSAAAEHWYLHVTPPVAGAREPAAQLRPDQPIRALGHEG